MSTLENLRFYADGLIIRDRQQLGQCVRFGYGATESLARKTAELLNEMPEWESKFIWEPAPALEGKAA